jgi:DNA-binding MarR family transcriptional regulator
MKKIINSEATADQIHSVAVHLLRRLRRADIVGDLSAPRLAALSVVVFGGPITLGDLADSEQVRPPTMTRIVTALEEQGLVVKSRDATDRRVIYIAPTMKGRRLLIAGRNRRIQYLANQIEKLDAQEQAILQSAIPVLRKMAQAI